MIVIVERFKPIREEAGRFVIADSKISMKEKVEIVNMLIESNIDSYVNDDVTYELRWHFEGSEQGHYLQVPLLITKAVSGNIEDEPSFDIDDLDLADDDIVIDNRYEPFIYEGVRITNPCMDETGRFNVNPIEYYGKENIKLKQTKTGGNE
jgi:hypothetical protein